MKQLELQLFGHGQIPSKAGTMDIERIDKKFYKYVYWNCVGCISAVALVHLGEGVHLMDCNNPYDSDADRKVVEAMSKLSYYSEGETIPF